MKIQSLQFCLPHSAGSAQSVMLDQLMNRREAIKLLGATVSAAGVAAQTPVGVRAAAVARNDDAVRKLLDTQITDPASPWRGSVPDSLGLHGAGPASGLIDNLTASFVEPSSRFH